MASSSPSLPSSLGLFSSLSLSSSSSASLPQEMEDGEYRNWAELPPELMSMIMLRLGAIDILENAQKVCTSWRRVSKDPSMWRKIVMHYLGEEYDHEIMCRHAVDRSQGGLVEIQIWHFCYDSLLTYIADSSSSLRSLKLAVGNQITDKAFVEALVKLPLLEDLEFSFWSLSAESLIVVGQSCPNMKTLKLNGVDYLRRCFESDDNAFGIAETMRGLFHHFQLYDNKLLNTCLNSILDNCPKLEYLDLRRCFHVNLVGDLEKRLERIVVRRPNDST